MVVVTDLHDASWHTSTAFAKTEAKTHGITSFPFKFALKKDSEDKVDRCANCIVGHWGKGKYMSQCREEINNASKPAEDPNADQTVSGRVGNFFRSNYAAARASAQTLKQRAVGTKNDQLIDCYKNKILGVMKAMKEGDPKLVKCEKQCAAIADEGQNGPADDIKAKEETGFTDILIPTLAHKLVESRRRTQIANAFL